MGRRAPGRADHESRLRPSYPPANRDGGYGLGGWPELAPAENLTAGAAAPVYVNQNTPRARPALWCFSVHRESELSSRRARPSARCSTRRGYGALRITPTRSNPQEKHEARTIPSPGDYLDCRYLSILACRLRRNRWHSRLVGRGFERSHA